MSNPESYEDFVELCVPVLQERGIMWKDYAVPGGTFRENLRREKGVRYPIETHPAAAFLYDNLKKEFADENGDIFINRVEEKVSAKEGSGVPPSVVKAVEVKV